MLTFHEENLSQRQTWLQSHAAMPRYNYITEFLYYKKETQWCRLPKNAEKTHRRHLSFHVVSQVDRPGAHSRDL